MRRMTTTKQLELIENNSKTLNEIGEKTAIYNVIADYGYSSRLVKFFNSVISDIIAKGNKWYIGLEADDDPSDGYVPVIATFTLGDPEEDNQIPFEFLSEEFWLGNETCGQAPYITINLTCETPEGASTRDEVQVYIDNGGILTINNEEDNRINSIAIAYLSPKQSNINVYVINSEIWFDELETNENISINNPVKVTITDVDTIN